MWKAGGFQSWLCSGLCGHQIRRAHLLETTLMLGKIEGKRRRSWRRISWLDSITDSMDTNLSKLWEIAERGAWPAAVHGFAKSWTRLSNGTTTDVVLGGCSSTPVSPQIPGPSLHHQSLWEMSIDGCYSFPVRMCLKLYFQKQSIWKKNLTLIFLVTISSRAWVWDSEQRVTAAAHRGLFQVRTTAWNPIAVAVAQLLLKALNTM